MYKIEKLDSNCFYVKFTGSLPKIAAEKFISDFEANIEDLEEFCVIVDLLDAGFLNVESIEIILNLLKRNNEKLHRSAFVMSENPPLDAEIKFLIEKAESPKRATVMTLEDAKQWTGVKKIVIKKE